MNNNHVILIGRLCQGPNYEIIPGSGTPFVNLKIGVDVYRGEMADVLLIGNLAQHPDYELLNGRPTMRFNLAVDRPTWMWRGERKADFLRVVAYDQRALLDHAFLQVGSKVLISGELKARDFPAGDGIRKKEVEVVANVDDGITFLDKIDYERGNAHRAQACDSEGRENPAGDYAPAGGGFFRVTARGGLAQAAFENLHGQIGGRLFVIGRLRSRILDTGKRVTEIVSRKIVLLHPAREEREREDM